MAAPEAQTAKPSGWLIVLGVALGGFFDGILLHQILQWHHLFSLVPAVASLRAQILWDGYFHALMYLLAGLALWKLWRRSRPAGWRARTTIGALLIGFGTWHVLDTLLSHWILGIHRIRVDSAQPLFWDLLWLVVFGLVPLLAGWWMARGGGEPGAPRSHGHGSRALLALAAVTSGAGVWALQPPTGRESQTLVVFGPGTRAADAVAAIREADATMLWSSPDMSVVVIDAVPRRRAGLYLRGALLVGGTGLPAGCAGWTDV